MLPVIPKPTQSPSYRLTSRLGLAERVLERFLCRGPRSDTKREGGGQGGFVLNFENRLSRLRAPEANPAAATDSPCPLVQFGELRFPRR
jgi:hypothetical protein